MKRIITLLILGTLISVLPGCYATTPHTYEGAGAGAVIGGVTGALLDHHCNSLFCHSFLARDTVWFLARAKKIVFLKHL